MAQKSGEKLKQTLLLIFVGLSVLLIGLIWIDSLTGPQEASRAPVRGVPQAVGPTAVITNTPISASAGQTPAATREHRGRQTRPPATSADPAHATPQPLEVTTETTTETTTDMTRDVTVDAPTAEAREPQQR